MSRPGLRFADTTNCVQLRTRTKFGECAFSYAGPAVWNLLPDDLHRAPTINSFKRKLKTYLFISAFSWFYFSFSYYILTFVLHRCSYFCNRCTVNYLWYDMICCWTCEHNILKVSELTSMMQIGTSPWDKGMKCSTLEVMSRLRSRKPGDRFGGMMIGFRMPYCASLDFLLN